MPMAGLFQALQRIAIVVHRVYAITDELKDFRSSISARVEKLESQMADLRERIVRLETSREADRSQMQAEVARFKAEVERAELRLTRSLPDSGTQPGR